MSFADPAVARTLALPVNRWGGNHTDRYNWRIDTWNTGADWFFENIAGCWWDCVDDPPADPSQGYRRIVDGDRATGAQTLLTLPMVGWVAKEAAYRQPLPCSFPVTAFPLQWSFDSTTTGVCGDGLASDGQTRLLADPALVNERSDAQLSADWIADIKARYGAGAVRWYGLGNEPALWDETHRDVHPQPTTSGELLSRSIALATVVKDADPGAQVLGLSEWGWPHYFESAAEEAGRPDPAKPAGVPLVGWFLDGMRAAGEARGQRLLDYLDLHYYRQGGSSTDVTRSLWDPAYVDPSWIGERIALIPRMRAWVEAHYPGTRLALSEYDLSVGDPVTDTLIQADTLGIFARERVDMAVRWDPPAPGDPVLDAFRVYRDYDGAGSRFGETWVHSGSADQSLVAVYGARRGSDGSLTILLVNKSGQPRSSALTLGGLPPAGRRAAQTWSWTAAAPALAQGADVALAGDGATTVELPARSLTLLVVPEDRSDDVVVPPPSAPPVPRITPRPPGPAPGSALPADRQAGRRRALEIGLPPKRRCIRGTTLRFKLRSPNGKRIRSARVGLRGRRAQRLVGRQLARPVVIRRLPRGSFAVKVHLQLAGERRTHAIERSYTRCR